MRFKLVLTSVGLLSIVTACDQQTEFAGKGRLGFDLSASKTLANMSGDGEVEQELPSIEDFSLSILQDEELLETWDSFGEMPSEVTFPAGAYKAKAWYGDIEVEGFDKPAFSGEKEFLIVDDELTTVSITTTLSNMKAAVTYSESFQSYFTSYKTRMESSMSNEVVFESAEQRSAYFKPGSLDVYVDVTTQTGASSTLAVASLDDTKAKSFYTFNLDVDAGTGVLTVTFDEETIKEPITIDVSDEALSSEPPMMSLKGFESGQTLEHTEGMPVEASEISAFVQSKVGVKSLIMNTKSDYLISQGFPAEINFAEMTAAEIDELENKWNLLVRGVASDITMSKMAYVDMKNFIEALPTDGTLNTHEFSFKGIDINSRMTDEVKLVVSIEPDQFALKGVESTMIGATEAIFNVSLDGDITRVNFAKLAADGAVTPLEDIEVLSSNVVNHQIKVKGLEVGNKVHTIKAYYGKKESETLVLEPMCPDYDVTMTDGAAWAKKAYLTMAVENAEYTDLVNEYVAIYVRQNGSSDWTKAENPQITDGIVLIEGLQPETNYELRSTCLANPSSDESYTSVVSFTTEKAAQVPNSNFDNWYSEKTDKNGKALTKNLNLVYWDKYFPWNNADSKTKSWSTVNQLTTSDGNNPTKIFGLPTPPYVGCKYVANSGTIPTTDKHDSKNAALIRSIGWGSGGAADNKTAPKKTTAGELFLGEFNTATWAPVYGIPFESRPSGMSFYYKYKPKNSADKFIAKIVVLDANKDIIAEAVMPADKCGAQGEYTQATVNLTYAEGKQNTKATSMYISFVSGTKLEKNDKDFSYPPFGNLSNGEFVGSQLYVDEVTLLY